ncbi:ATP-binding protein [Streptomyces sp. Da 82-17]|uniref:ATP-binding protein n=1 Tax=Streptomyces sp. Da 82-17 TaxID=3377116 RepID=UPI0038D44C8F
MTEPQPQTPAKNSYTPHPYVAGRDAVLRLLADWRAERSGIPRTVALTGTPGAGRTRLVTGFIMLCDDEFRQRLPLTDMDPAIIPPDLPTAPLVPRPGRLTVEDFPGALAHHLGLATPPEGPARMRELGAGLAALSEPVTIVVPDIDHADRRAADGSARLVRDVLRPLAATDNVRLLLDLPRELVGELTRDLPADDILVIDVDDPQWWNADGLAGQVETALDPQLGAPELPFTTDPAERTALAAAITRRAGNNVLVMDLVVRGLFAAPDDFACATPDDEQRLPVTVGAALMWHAERTGTTPETLHTALAPLALTAADSLPESMWRRLVDAVNDTGTDPAALLGTSALEPFVSREEPRGAEARLKLVHPVLGTEVLSVLKNVPDQQSRIAVSLLQTVPEQDWARADSYVKDHIAEHTLQAGLLPRLLTDPGLFVHADPVRLLAAVSAVPVESLGAPAHTYLRTAPLFIRTGAHPPQRAALLETAFLQDGLDEFAEAIRRLPVDLPWQTLWTLPVPGVRGISSGTLLPPENADESGPVQLAKAAAVLVVPATTPGALPLQEGSEAGLLVRDLNRPVPLDTTDLTANSDRLGLTAEDVRRAAPLAFDVGPHAVQVWDRKDDRELTTFHSAEPIVDADISPDDVLLVATESCATALRVRRALSSILT